MQGLFASVYKPRRRETLKPLATALSIPQSLENHALRSLAVPLAVKDPLPGTEVEPAGGDRHDHLMADRERPEVGRGVVLACPAVMAIPLGIPRRDRLLEPIEDVLPKTRLVV